MWVSVTWRVFAGVTSGLNSNRSQLPMSSSPLPVFLYLLADRKLMPGAARLALGTGAEEALPLLLAQPDFTDFLAGFPCLLAADAGRGLPDDLLTALQALGCKPITRGLIHGADEAVRPVMPPQAQWLEGDWYLAAPARPTATQSASRTLALKLVQLVVADAETREIEAILRQDPTLSYHLLRLVNSLGMGATRRITSFSQAILILGRLQLRRWLNLMLFAARSDDHRASMLLAQVAVRSRTMELLARQRGLDRADQELAFMTGMFSMLGTLFGMPLPEVLKPLQLSEALVAAVLRGEGEMGLFLQVSTCAAQGDAQTLQALLSALELSPEQLSVLCFEAFYWMLGIVRDTQGAPHA